MICSLLVNTDQQKKEMKSIRKCYIFKFKFDCIFINFLSILDHFQVVLIEPLKYRGGGYPDH